MVQINLFAKQKETQCREKNIWTPREETGWEELGDWD